MPRPLQVVIWTASQRSQLRSHCACQSGYSCSIRVLTLKVMGLPVPKIWLIFSHGICPTGDLDLWPFDLGAGAECMPWHGQRSCHFLCFCEFSLSIYGQTWIRLTIHVVMTLTSDLYMGSRVTCVMGSFLPIFSLLRPSVLDLWSGRGQTDRRTDDGHDVANWHSNQAAHNTVKYRQPSTST